MNQFLSKIGIGAVFLVLFIYGYGSFCDYFFTQDRFLDLSEKKQWVLAQKGGSFDYAVLGSSRAYGAFDMVLLDSLTGKNGINLGSNGSGFKDNLLVLNLFLKKNKVKKLFLQVDMGALNSKTSFSNEFHGFTFLPYWEDPLIREVVNNEFPNLNNRFTNFFPQWRYFYFNKYFSPKEVIRRGKLGYDLKDPFTLLKGGMESTRIPVKKEAISTYPWPNSVDPEDWKYLIKLMEYSESLGIEVVFFTAPRYQDDQKALKTVLIQLPNTTIYPEDFDEFDQSLFQDQGHMNGYGRFLFTDFFNQNLKSLN